MNLKEKSFGITGEISLNDYLILVQILDNSDKIYDEETEKTAYSSKSWKIQIENHPWIMKKYNSPVLYKDIDGDYFWWGDFLTREMVQKNLDKCEIIHIKEFKSRFPEYFI
jgi:hypothetical protein